MYINIYISMLIYMCILYLYICISLYLSVYLYIYPLKNTDVFYFVRWMFASKFACILDYLSTHLKSKKCRGI